jgi:hypothetical protein
LLHKEGVYCCLEKCKKQTSIFLDEKFINPS